MSKLNCLSKSLWAYTIGIFAIFATLTGCTAITYNGAEGLDPSLSTPSSNEQPLSTEADPESTSADDNDSASNQAPNAQPQDGEERTIEGIDFVYVPAGPFTMGSTDEDTDYALQLCEQYWDAQWDRDNCKRSWYEREQPQSTDASTDAFWIMQYELTTVQFRGFVEGDGYTNDAYWTDAGWLWKTRRAIESPFGWGEPSLSADDLPVVGINWYEAFAFAAWLSAQTGQEFRLPTEAEWEKAARGTDGRIFTWGNEWEPERIHYCDLDMLKNESDKSNYKCATLLDPGGSFDNASPYNAYDMSGNVWEWTSSRGVDYPYEVDERESPDGEHERVLRGGSWQYNLGLERTATRFITEPDRQMTHQGMRLVISTK